MSRPFLRDGISVPLRCTLCPKTPQFSDISHLLTHISSKGHLSHKFKLGIRAQSESQARTQLETFEIWYADNALDELLAERLASKEQKNPTKRVRNAPKAVSRHSNQEQDQQCLILNTCRLQSRSPSQKVRQMASSIGTLLSLSTMEMKHQRRPPTLLTHLACICGTLALCPRAPHSTPSHLAGGRRRTHMQLQL